MVLEKLVSVVALAAALMEGSMDAAMPDKDIDGTLFLINRQHMVSDQYIPEIRKTVGASMGLPMRDEAATALEEMFAACREEADARLVTISGYRGYSKQKAIYNRKLKTTSKAKADSLVALPGASEHQLGMAMDLAMKGSSQLNSGFGKTKGGQWVNANCWRFGFIVRYQEGFEETTGYAFEPWHVRYVGKEHAKAVYESGVPLEDYLSAYRLQVYDYLIQISE